MKKKVLLIGLLLFLAVSAQAAIINGGFETGTAAGWTMSGDYAVIGSYTPQFVVTDPTWTPGIAYYGNYSLMLGSGDIGNVWDDYHASSAYQLWNVDQADVDNGLHLYFRWGALLEEPTNGVFHATSQQPFFSITIEDYDGTSWNTVYSADESADQASAPTFSRIGRAASGDAGDIWFGGDIANIDLSTLGLVAGDRLRLTLNVRDCTLGGHGGLVFLDGFGLIPPSPVPEPATLLLVGAGLIGVATYRKRMKS